MGDRPNVILTGFMGTGKTTVGRLVALHLGFEFVDTDELIESEHGPIPELFADQGEAAFRAIEREVATELASRCNLVVATGGGMMVDEQNVAALAATGTVVCLTADVDTIVDRALSPGGPVRPLLAGVDPRTRVDELLVARAHAYGRFAQIDTTDMTPAEVADAVIDLIDLIGDEDP
jgi:shikimate kinase